MLVSEMLHGGLKASGYGNYLSIYALEDYTVARHVMVKRGGATAACSNSSERSACGSPRSLRGTAQGSFRPGA